MNFQKEKVFRHLLFDLGYTGDHLITRRKLVIHWCELLNYREKQERERERETAAPGMLKQEDGTVAQLITLFFHISLSYIALCLHKQVILKLAQEAKQAFCHTSFRKVSFLLL